MTYMCKILSRTSYSKHAPNELTLHMNKYPLHEKLSFDSLLWSTKYEQKSVHLIRSSFVEFCLSKGCLWSFVVIKGEQKTVFYLLSSSKDINIWSLIFCSVESWSKDYIWHFVGSKDDAKMSWHLTFLKNYNILEEITKIFPIWFVMLYFIGCCYDNGKSLHIHKFFSWAHN